MYCSISVCLYFRVHGNGTGHSCLLHAEGPLGYQVQSMSMFQAQYMIVSKYMYLLD